MKQQWSMNFLAIIGEKAKIFQHFTNPTAAVEETSSETTEETTEDAVEAIARNKFRDIPEGVIVVTMPRLSDTMEEGTVASWLKNVGDAVEEGDILAEIETDKATMEFESFNEGTLLYIGLQEGESAKSMIF